MKKIICFMVILCTLMAITGCQSNDPLTYEQLTETEEVFTFLNYAFYEKSNEVAVVAKLDHDKKEVVEIKEFDTVTSTAEAFSKIERGMSVYEVVELVGLPTRSVTFGIASTDFETEDGVWRVQWDTDPSKEIITVISVATLKEKNIGIEVGMTYAEVRELMESDGNDIGSGVILYVWNLFEGNVLYVWFEAPEEYMEATFPDDCIVQRFEIRENN